MTSTPSDAPLRLVESLARVSRKHPVARKLLVSTTLAAGRELVHRLSLGGDGWIGFEITTPRPLALRLARADMERGELSVLDAFDARALLDEAIDYALGSDGERLGILTDGVGFREKVQGAIEALRLAEIGPTHVERARLPDGEKRRFLTRTLQRYEQLLRERRRVDGAGIFRMALTALEAEGSRLSPALDVDLILLLPGLGTRGLPGRLVAALGARGAKVLETDPVVGLDASPRVLWKPGKEARARSYLHAPGAVPEGTELPRTELFRAASVNDELREVMRRAVGRGLRWDQVEIVTPDPTAYGSALHVLAARLRVPVTYAVGLPVDRTRTGRVARTYLDWIEEGFQADPIRRLLEAGDLRPPHARGPHAPAALARRFRALRVGWGRRRYRTQIRAALKGAASMAPGRHDTEEGFAKRRDRTKGEIEALRAILFPTLKATPAVPDRMGEEGSRVSPAQIARGLRAFLRRVPRGSGPEREAREEVDRVLERVEATLVRRTEFRAAVTVLRRHLDLRVRARASSEERGEAAAPWSSEGGHLHLSDLEHGGFTGREAVFIVGLDADRAPGFEVQDPVLLDGDRRVLGEDLPTSTELSREQSFRFAGLFARLGGSVTLSYSAWNAADARALSPSPVLLQALRLSRGDAALTFADLEAELGRVVCAVPHGRRAPLDGEDVWMAELGRGEVLREGVDVVARAFPRLARGLGAREALDGPPGPRHGVVAPRPEALDPRRNSSLVVSASRLEALGTCPLRYLHGTVLGIRPPDDPELDPDRWLDGLRRGALLHGVYERTLREARDRGVQIDDDAFEEVAREALRDGIVRMQAEMPVPGEGALRRESVALANDVRSFVRMVRRTGAPWVALELKFGLGDDEPVLLDVEGQALRLRGAIDRIDEDLAGLKVVDYKTGSARDFAGTGAFNGGRRLQHALYARVAEARLDREVVRGEYHFPTIRGENRSVGFDRLRLAGVTTLVARMLEGVAEGCFVPTDRADDCRFCDFAEICRARDGGYGKTVSPLAEWSEQQANAGLWPAFASLKRVRGFEG
jgi:CRISPR/Cas system-associated exonuclease Cas4 (RecB family)